jgi:predicted nuclease of predicted toxin-antitoxin system
MKLLFDENLSPKLPRLLSQQFPESLHVRDCGLKGFSDEVIWAYARDNGFTIVSKDADFYQRSVLYGYPPKIVWLRIGNCTRADLVNLIETSRDEIFRFMADPFEAVLVLNPIE